MASYLLSSTFDNENGNDDTTSTATGLTSFGPDSWSTLLAAADQSHHDWYPGMDGEDSEQEHLEELVPLTDADHEDTEETLPVGPTSGVHSPADDGDLQDSDVWNNDPYALTSPVSLVWQSEDSNEEPGDLVVEEGQGHFEETDSEGFAIEDSDSGDSLPALPVQGNTTVYDTAMYNLQTDAAAAETEPFSLPDSPSVPNDPPHFLRQHPYNLNDDEINHISSFIQSSAVTLNDLVSIQNDLCDHLLEEVWPELWPMGMGLSHGTFEAEHAIRLIHMLKRIVRSPSRQLWRQRLYDARYRSAFDLEILPPSIWHCLWSVADVAELEAEQHRSQVLMDTAPSASISTSALPIHPRHWSTVGDISRLSFQVDGNMEHQRWIRGRSLRHIAEKLGPNDSKVGFSEKPSPNDSKVGFSDLPAELRLRIFNYTETWADFRSLRQTDSANAELTCLYADKGLDLARFEPSTFSHAFLIKFIHIVKLPNVVFGRLFELLPVSRIPWTSDYRFVGDYLADQEINSVGDPRVEGFIQLGILGRYIQEKREKQATQPTKRKRTTEVVRLQPADYHAILERHEKWINDCHTRNINDTLKAICRFFAEPLSILKIQRQQGPYGRADTLILVAPLNRIGLGSQTAPTLTQLIGGLRILGDDLLALGRKFYHHQNDGLSAMTRGRYVRAVHCFARTLHDIIFKCLHPARSANFSLSITGRIRSGDGEDIPYNRFLVNTVVPFAIFLCKMLGEADYFPDEENVGEYGFDHYFTTRNIRRWQFLKRDLYQFTRSISALRKTVLKHTLSASDRFQHDHSAYRAWLEEFGAPQF